MLRSRPLFAAFIAGLLAEVGAVVRATAGAIVGGVVQAVFRAVFQAVFRAVAQAIFAAAIALASAAGPAAMAGLALGLIAATPASADRSRLADEADVVEAGDCEIELAAERRRARSEPRERESAAQASCGLGARTEAALALGRAGSAEGREYRRTAAGRTALVERRGRQVGWALEYGVEQVRLRDSGAWRTSQTFVAIQAARRFGGPGGPGGLFGGDWLVQARLGSSRDRLEHRSERLWALEVERTLIGQGLELRAGISREGRARALAELGLRVQLWSEDIALTLSVGNGGGPPRRQVAGAALSIEF
jgi:hypothetical protein